MSKGYIDFKAIEKVPNKYNLKPNDIRKFRVLDWNKLKKKTWHNDAMKNGNWWCHIEGSDGGGFYGNEDDFWIGFNEDDGKVRYHFTSGEGMCKYNFPSFYSSRSIENKWDMNVQINAMRFLNMLLDEGIVELPL